MKSEYKFLVFTVLTTFLSLLVIRIIHPDDILGSSVICSNSEPSKCNGGGISWWDTNKNMNFDDGEQLVVEQTISTPEPTLESTPSPVLGTTQPVATTAPNPTSQPSNGQQCTTICVQEKLVCN